MLLSSNVAYPIKNMFNYNFYYTVQFDKYFEKRSVQYLQFVYLL